MTSVVLGERDSFAPSSMSVHNLTSESGQRYSVLLVRIEDSFYALDNVCSHADVALVDGTLWADECEVECPKHGSLFSLTTGEPATLPATQPVSVFEVVLTGNTVEVVLP